MKIGTLGAGNMADALTTQWARAGHEVRIGARSAGTLREAAEFGEVVLVAVPHAVAAEVVGSVGPLDGKVLVDCTNPTGPPGFVLSTGHGPSAAERLAEAAPGAHVVKAFNLCHESIWRMTPPVFDGRPLGVPVCGDDPEAVAVVERLVRDLGCDPLPGGGLARAGLLEATAAFAIGLWAAGADPVAMFPPVESALG